MRKRLIERAPREAKRRGGDGGAEDVERAHGDLEALSGTAEPPVRRKTAAFETQCGQRMRGHDVDTFGDRETGVVREDQERRDSTGARRFAGAGEQRVDISDPAVRDPGLLAVQAISVPVLARRASHGRDIGASLLLRERESGEPLAAADLWQTSLRCSSEPAIATAPEPRPCIAKAKSASPSW